MEEEFLFEEEYGGDLVVDGFGGMEVPHVEGEHRVVPAHDISHVELVGADDIVLGGDSEEFAFDGVADVFLVAGDGEDFVVCLAPSGIQWLTMQVSPMAFPMASPILREAMAWRIQNLRTLASAEERV